MTTTKMAKERTLSFRTKDDLQIGASLPFERATYQSSFEILPVNLSKASTNRHIPFSGTPKKARESWLTYIPSKADLQREYGDQNHLFPTATIGIQETNPLLDETQLFKEAPSSISDTTMHQTHNTSTKLPHASCIPQQILGEHSEIRHVQTGSDENSTPHSQPRDVPFSTQAHSPALQTLWSDAGNSPKAGRLVISSRLSSGIKINPNNDTSSSDLPPKAKSWSEVVKLGGDVVSSNIGVACTTHIPCTPDMDLPPKQVQPELASPSPSMSTSKKNTTDDRPRFRRFSPSRKVTGRRRRSLTPVTAARVVESGIFLKRNPNYEGEITDFDFRNANVPDSDNCSVRLTSIHPEATLEEIFDVVRTGKVFSFHLSPPIHGVHINAAARLVFLERECAENLIKAANSINGLVVHGQRIGVVWNRDRVGPANTKVHSQSRVVRVQGPKEKLTVDWLLDEFRKLFLFDLVAAKELYVDSKMRAVEVSFTSIRAQGEMAVMGFRELYPAKEESSHNFKICYSPDPCQPHREESDDSIRCREPGRHRRVGSLVDPLSLAKWRS